MKRLTRMLSPTARPNLSAAVSTLLTAAALAGACAAGPAQAGDQDGVTRKAVVDLNSCAKPAWPAASLAAHQTGTVSLRFLIDTEGQVKDAQVDKSSGHAALDQAARDGIARCRFQPAQANGKSVESWVQLQYVWTLK